MKKTWPPEFVVGNTGRLAHAEARRQVGGRRGAHDPPASTPELRAAATDARLRAYALRREVAHALYQGRLGFMELQKLVRLEPAISHMRLKPVLDAMKWDTSRLTEWRLRELAYDPNVKLGQLRKRQWAVLVSAWPQPDVARMARCLAQPGPGVRAAERAAIEDQEREEQERRLAGWRSPR